MAPLFPILDRIDPILDAINGIPTFRVIQNPEGFCSVDYLYQDEAAFGSLLDPDPVARARALLCRECRGIKFDPNGVLLGRPYHKFFGLNAMPETQAAAIDWTQPHKILDKLDGSMVHPIWLHEKPVLTTRKTIGQVAPNAQRFAEQHADIAYTRFFAAMRHQQLSPILEWCSRQNRIVIDHPEDQLVLTAVRSHRDGTYLSQEEMAALARPFGVPVVKVLGSDIEDLTAFLATIKTLRGQEGCVVRFDDGMMLKIKSDEYLLRHGALDLLTREAAVLKIILNNQDDDFMASLIDPAWRQAVGAFAQHVRSAMGAHGARLDQALARFKDGLPNDPRQARKVLSQALSNNAVIDDPVLARLAFQAFDQDGTTAVLEFLRKHTSTLADIDRLRPYFGGRSWREFYPDTANSL